MLKKVRVTFLTLNFWLISVAYGNVPAPGLRKGKTRSQEFLRIVFWTNAEEILQPRRHNGHRSTVSASDFGTYIRVPENECRKIDCMINTQHDVATESVSNLCKHVSATGRIRKERVYEKHICKHDARIPPGYATVCKRSRAHPKKIGVQATFFGRSLFG